MNILLQRPSRRSIAIPRMNEPYETAENKNFFSQTATILFDSTRTSSHFLKRPNFRHRSCVPQQKSVIDLCSSTKQTNKLFYINALKFKDSGGIFRCDISNGWMKFVKGYELVRSDYRLRAEHYPNYNYMDLQEDSQTY